MDEELKHLRAVVQKDFLSDEEHLPSFAGLEEVRNWMKPIVKNYLDRDMQGLLNLAYRLDINEEKFKNTLATGSPLTLVDSLTDLIIQRELEKVAYRIKYS